jgi:hypothetical protein
MATNATSGFGDISDIVDVLEGVGKRQVNWSMRARFGDVLYWVGCVLAALIVAIDTYVWVREGFARSDGLWVSSEFQLAALIVWLIGRGCRYVLSGK